VRVGGVYMSYNDAFGWMVTLHRDRFGYNHENSLRQKFRWLARIVNLCMLKADPIRHPPIS
jgi:hypothetical protein